MSLSVLDALTKRAGRIAGDLQGSLRRARLEGERRLLQRQHRGTLEDLGGRVFELVRSGEIPEGSLAPEIAAVESKLMEIEAKVAEIDALRDDDEDGEPVDAASAAFPMVGRTPGGEPGNGSAAGPGWAAAERFFRH